MSLLAYWMITQQGPYAPTESNTLHTYDWDTYPYSSSEEPKSDEELDPLLIVVCAIIIVGFVLLITALVMAGEGCHW